MLILDKQIKARANLVAKHYPELRAKDLIQEAYKLILEIVKKRGLMSVPYLSKAVYHHFSNLIDKTHAKRKLYHIPIDNHISDSLIDEQASAKFQHLENDFDRQKFIDTISNKQQLAIINGLLAGDNVSEIAKNINVPIRTVYRQINRLKEYREKWEGNQ